MPRTRKGPANESARAFLKAYRQAESLTQELLSERIEVKQQQISKYETGKNKIPFELVVTIEELWGVSVRNFMRSGSESAEQGIEGFMMKGQAGYLVDLSIEVQEDADGQQGEQMKLDLSPIEDPADRQKVRDLYQTLLSKQNGA
jgi:transcriptional regulator with XRE-family HTH domain